MEFKKWFENYWYHHAAKTIVVGLLIISAIALMINVAQKSDPDFVMAYVGEAYGSDVQFEPIRPKAEELVGDLNGDGKTKVNSRIITIRKGTFSEVDVNKEQEFNYSFLDTAVHFYIIEEQFLRDKAIYFEPLEALLPPEALEGGMKNEAGEVYAVPLRDNIIAKEMDFARENMYVAVKKIMDIEKNEEIALKGQEISKALLQYMITEAK